MLDLYGLVPTGFRPGWQEPKGSRPRNSTLDRSEGHQQYGDRGRAQKDFRGSHVTANAR
jgi:hypothetical protein